MKSFAGSVKQRWLNVLNIKHSIAGRTRFKYTFLKNNIGIERAVTAQLANLEGIKSVRINVICGSIIVEFDKNVINNADLIKTISKAKAVHVDETPEEHISCNCADPKKSSLKRRTAEFSALSAVMGGVFIRSRLTSAVLSQSLFSPLGLIAAAFSLPLLYKSAKEIKETKRVTLSSFLGAGVASAVVAGEALTALEILWVNSGSELLSSYVAERSRKAVKSILDVTAKTAFIYKDGVEIELPVEKVHKGDLVVIHTGEKISVDGIITKGEAMVNEAPVSGRSELQYRTVGDKLYAGTYVQDGLVYVEAENVGDYTYLARILHMVEDSLESKAPIELEADRLARRLINIGFIMTGGTLLFTRNLYRAFSVLLVMACPCATILSASSAVSAALNNAASKGILIKGGRYLEEAGSQESFCFDKTGTLTTDDPEVIAVIPAKGFTEEDVMTSAYVAELHNRHPVATAIRSKANEMELVHPSHAVCDTILGMGVRAESEGHEFFIGNKKMMNKYSLSSKNVDRLAKPRKEMGETVIYVAKNDQVQGLICISNSIKDSVDYVIQALREEGVKELIMVTGDEERTAKNLADKLGFDKCYASVLPQQKAEIVKEIQKEHKVTMIGDGINDVLALVDSDLGIAMGAMGSDVAIEAADIALVDDDLEKILHLRMLSRKTKEVINQNFMLATGSNILGAFLGAAGILSPVMAGMIHISHTLGVMANSSRLLSYSPDMPEKAEEDND